MQQRELADLRACHISSRWALFYQVFTFHVPTQQFDGGKKL
jgi:mRNA-degrading endonuclease YafQ of YafQ-DinJ toxin-antitoxin module